MIYIIQEKLSTAEKTGIKIKKLKGYKVCNLFLLQPLQ